MRFTALLLLTLIGSATTAGEKSFPQFKPRVIDPRIGKVCYAVTLADVDGDEKQDIVAVSENRVVWYKNPSWQPQVIIKDQTPRDNVCIAPLDIDGDGKVDFALGAGWTRIGTIHWLRRRKSLKQPWNVYKIGEERWLHRMRWADVLGIGKKQLVISPLNRTSGKGVRLTAFAIPKNPTKDRWRPYLINAEFNRMHNHWHTNIDGRGPTETLTASQEGVHLLRLQGKKFTKTRISSHSAGEIKLGKLKDGTIFIATVEPMHGTALGVYTLPRKPGGKVKRLVIDKGFRRGHALWLADVDGDGSDEIVFGHSDTPKTFGVNVYDLRGDRWQKHVVDRGGMATEDLIVADLTGDGRPDIVAGGRATHNVKLYVNVGR